MRCKLLLIAIGLLVLLTACGGECKTATDCAPRSGFDASCVEKTCQYSPIPGVCGNNQCEPDAGENECTCAQDCGQCTGQAAGSQYLGKTCVNDECVEDVTADISPIYTSSEASSAGDKFSLEMEYNNPFNLKHDVVTFTISLKQTGRNNNNHRVTGLELTGTTQDRRTITLGKKDVNKPLWTTNDQIVEELRLDFPTADLEGEISNMILSVNYDYLIETATTTNERSATVKNRYNEKLTFVNPGRTYECPESCDDGNPGTRDTCGAQTDYFCVHEPIPNTCGNFICDGNENRCTCAQDCGPCSGSAGEYLDYTCKASKCITEPKPGVTIQPNSLFDDRSLGPVQLNNNFKYNDPFNVNEDSFTLDFAIYRQDPTVSETVIETVRLLEGQQQLAETQVDQKLSETPTTVTINLPDIPTPEEEHQITIGIWYKYVQDGNERRGNYQKPLGRITLISPGP